MGLLLPPLLPLLLFEGGGVLPASWRQRFPRCTLEDSSSFQRCSNLVNHTRDFPRLAWKIINTHYRSSLPFAQQWTVIAVIPTSSVSSVKCTAPRWCGWECFSPFTSAASQEFSTHWDCSCEHSPGCTRTYVHTWDCSCNIHWDVLVLLDVADVHQCNNVDFPCLLL